MTLLNVKCEFFLSLVFQNGECQEFELEKELQVVTARYRHLFGFHKGVKLFCH